MDDNKAMKVNIYIISIVPERKKSLIQRLKNAPLPSGMYLCMNDVLCVDGRNHPGLPGRIYPQWYIRDAPPPHKTEWRRMIRKAEIGCCLSHFQALRQISVSDAAINIIFEDDATIEDTLFFYLQKCLKQIPDDWDMLYLGRNQFIQQSEKKVSNDLVIPSWSYNAHAIVWRRQAAVSMVESIPEWMVNQIPFDDYIPALCGSHSRDDLNNLYQSKLTPYSVAVMQSVQIEDGIHMTRQGH